jgi:single-strand DNA-binding protein
MYNRVIIAGNLGQAPELRYTASGTAVTNMSVAVNTKEKVNGEWKDVTYWASIVVWGKQAESCAQYLDKGRQVLVEGKLQRRGWESNGEKKHKTEIVASTVKFIGGKGEQSSGPAPDEISDIEPF